MTPRLPGFVFRSLRSSFRSERLTHLLTISTVCACLALVAGVHLVQRNLVDWAGQWADSQAVVVFVDGETDSPVRMAIETAARQRADLRDLEWRAPTDTAGDLAAALGIRGEAGLEEFAPWLLRGTRGPDAVTGTAAALANLPAVLHVDEGTVMAARIREVARSIRLGGLGLSILLLMGCFLVVSNTVGLALNARRDEVEIMDLVGTPLHWIYLAYLTEGVVLGLCGALIAAGLLELPLWIGAAAWIEGFGLPPLAGLTGGEFALLACGGALIGAAGSTLAIRRFLRPNPA